MHIKAGHKTYTEAFSGGVVKGGSGYFSSSVCVIISESAIHCSSSFTTGTLPCGLIFKNLNRETNDKQALELNWRKQYSRYLNLIFLLRYVSGFDPERKSNKEDGN